jgi:hypothetical protein
MAVVVTYELTYPQFVQILQQGVAFKYFTINDKTVVVAHDGGFHAECILEGADLIDFMATWAPKQPPRVGDPMPFANKKIGAKSLFKRVYGVRKAITQQDNKITWTVPLPWLKINAVQVVGSDGLITADFFVKDSSLGSYSGVPNYTLNQMAFDAVVPDLFFEERSQYDADLYLGMQLELDFGNIPDGGLTIGVNFICHEVK